MYGLDVLRADVEDEHHNTTRFLVMAHEPDDAPQPAPGSGGKVVTSFVFRVRNVPAALYKAMGGFATNGVNMTKLESYQLGGSFNATQFYADIEGHPDERGVRLALEELKFFTSKLTVLGVYPAHPFQLRSALRRSQLGFCSGTRRNLGGNYLRHERFPFPRTSSRKRRDLHPPTFSPGETMHLRFALIPKAGIVLTARAADCAWRFCQTDFG